MQPLLVIAESRELQKNLPEARTRAILYTHARAGDTCILTAGLFAILFFSAFSHAHVCAQCSRAKDDDARSALACRCSFVAEGGTLCDVGNTGVLRYDFYLGVLKRSEDEFVEDFFFILLEIRVRPLGGGRCGSTFCLNCGSTLDPVPLNSIHCRVNLTVIRTGVGGRIFSKIPRYVLVIENFSSIE